MPTIEITIGPLEEKQKRGIAKGISQVLTDYGIPEEVITIIFRHVTGKDIAKGGGVFPYWPEEVRTVEDPR